MNTINEKYLENSKNKKKKEYEATIASNRYKQTLLQASPISQILLMLHAGYMS